ncbi:hypothetical protein [Serratia oryzae]|uniref:Uncharacterized protein n=1 Tax=Serratia oryzae TaxID=2034155 RepID=A0A1S8CRQ2_9GAMM|nr:hypothetical protein [Serratia oryzae]OMQ27331.1 hypothetical protein BMI79_03125 [Serratia oryzae]
MAGYFISRGILVTSETYDAFIADVYKIKFTGKDKRQAPRFYADIQGFLQHLICNTLLYADQTPESDPYTVYAPFSSKLGKKKLPFVFEQSKYLVCKRALELLKKEGIIKIKQHHVGKKKCREFALSKEHIKRWFGDFNHREYMRNEQRYIYLSTAVKVSDKKTLSFDDMIGRALDKMNKPKHKTRHVSRETVKYMKEVYSNMGGLRINLDKWRDFEPKDEIEAAHKAHFISHLLSRGCRMVSSVPLIVEYYPEYKLSSKGTRSFELHRGFQGMKSSLKWKIFEGYNYDIESSQFNILKGEFKKYGIKCSRLNELSKEKIMERFDISSQSAKTLLYSCLFSLCKVKLSPKSKSFAILCDEYGYDMAAKKLRAWGKYIAPIKRKLEKLITIYISQGVNCPGRGLAIRNAVSQTYLLRGEKNEPVKASEWGKILAHMLQGLESRAIYDTILANPGVCGSIEHDGLVSSEPIEWNHPYLKLVLKHKSE